MTSAKRVEAKCGPSGRLRNLDDALRRKEVISRSARASTSSVPHTAALATQISIRRRDGCVFTVCPAENTGSNSRRNGPAGYANCLGSERIGSAWRGVGQNLMLRLIRRSHAPSGDVWIGCSKRMNRQRIPIHAGASDLPWGVDFV
jgi:hypothetical protein